MLGLALLVGYTAGNNVKNTSFIQEMMENVKHDDISDSSCNLTLHGKTWDFNASADLAIPGSGSASECGEDCLDLAWCVGYTWTHDDAAGSMCHLFHELNNLHPCSECS